MKLLQITILLIALAWLSACEEKIDYKKEESLSFDVDQDIQSALQQNHLPQLAVKLGCNNCHALDHRLVGPAWKEVGKRYHDTPSYEYEGKQYPVQDGLIEKVSHGGSGNWGEEAMPAIDPPGSRRVQIGKLVGFILELGKQ